MTSSTVPPVRQRASQSDVSEYSATTSFLIQSRIVRNARLVIVMASCQSASETVRSRYAASCSAKSCGLIAATILTFSPLSSSFGSSFTRFAVVIVPCTKIVP